MIELRIEALTGINNVDDYRKAARWEFNENVAVFAGHLKSCVNFRCNKDGTADVRNGFTEIVAAAGGHSFWTNEREDIALFILEDKLYRLNTDDTITQLTSGLRAGARMNYIEHEKPRPEKYAVFMGNGYSMLKYDPVIGTVSTWGDALTDARWEEFESPKLTYCVPVPSNILLSYRARTYTADGRFLLYSKEGYPESFRKVQNIPAYEDITALSGDNGHIYIHSLNRTKVLSGMDPDDFIESEYPIGAVKHGSVSVYGMPYILTKRGWAVCHDGIVEYLDHENFRLNLDDDAEAYLRFDKGNREVICTIRQ